MQIAYAMLPLSAQLKDFWFRRLASLQEQKFTRRVATVNHLCMVDHVKFLMHLKLYDMLQHNYWGLTDGSPLQNIGARAPRIDVGLHRMSQRSTDTSDRIHYQ